MAITSKMLGARGRRQAEKLGIDPARVPLGFWELNGYHNDADPWLEQRHWF
jgi:hypothetical protein